MPERALRKDFSLTGITELGRIFSIYGRAVALLFCLGMFFSQRAVAQANSPRAGQTNTQSAANPAGPSSAADQNLVSQNGGPRPEALLLPWHFLGIDDEPKRLAQEALAKARESLAIELLGATSPLSDWLEDQPVTLNRRRLTDNVMSSSFVEGKNTGKAPADTFFLRPNEQLVLQPLWCQTSGFEVFILAAVASPSEEVIALTNVALPRGAWRDIVSRGNQVPKLGALAKTLAARLMEQTDQRPAPTSGLKLRLDLMSNPSRADRGSDLCLNAMMIGSLAPRHRTLWPFTGSAMELIRSVGLLGRPGIDPVPSRANRALQLHWDRSKSASFRSDQRATNREGSAEAFKLTLRRVEAILGRSIGQPWRGTVRLERAGQGLGIALPPEVESMLLEEERSLRPDELPQVAKVYGAWAYLDRGRAWGLEMKDRLIATSEDGQIIKGHVVRFFGPEENLKSPRGFPVTEGAILFIRKNQQGTAIGQTFDFDPLTFPTPWPPGKQ